MSKRAKFCGDHPEAPARARCSTCGRGLCNECFRFRLDDAPACARCAFELATRPQRRVSLAVAFVAAVLGGLFYAIRRFDLWRQEPVVVVLLAGLTPIVGAIIARSSQDARGVRVENRDSDDGLTVEEVPDEAGSPYRAGVRRVLLTASPKVSGSLTALVVGVSLVGSAVLLPFALELPRWLEVEVVLVAWWAVVATTLSVMLHRDFRLRDDFIYFLPWDRPSAPSPTSSPSSKQPATSKKGSWFDLGGGCSSFDGEGVVILIVVGAALLLGFGAAWVLVELALPLLFLLMYSVMMRAIRRVARDNRGCAGDLLRSAAWGAAWATIYLCPIALVTWVAHAVRR